MSKRYDGSQKALDLKSLRVDPGELRGLGEGLGGLRGVWGGCRSQP